MIAGAHLLLYSKDPEADRAFLTTMQEYQPASQGSIDASGGEIGLYQTTDPTMIEACSA